ncbi:MAG: hypothetical protein AAFO07_25995, partial [Bacteroidota bacterium]
MKNTILPLMFFLAFNLAGQENLGIYLDQEQKSLFINPSLIDYLKISDFPKDLETIVFFPETFDTNSIDRSGNCEIILFRDSLIETQKEMRELKINWDQIESFKKLKSIYLWDTNFKSLPHNFGKLDQLEYLDISFTLLDKNDVKDLILELKNLKEINAVGME